MCCGYCTYVYTTHNTYKHSTSHRDNMFKNIVDDGVVIILYRSRMTSLYDLNFAFKAINENCKQTEFHWSTPIFTGCHTRFMFLCSVAVATAAAHSYESPVQLSESPDHMSGWFIEVTFGFGIYEQRHSMSPSRLFDWTCNEQDDDVYLHASVYLMRMDFNGNALCFQ